MRSIPQTTGRRPRRLAVMLVSTCAFFALAAAAAAAAPTPPFKQCPPVGADTSCGTLIVVNASGGVEAFNDPSQGPFDGIEDTLVGVENQSGKAVKELELSGTEIFGFDGDGICSGAYTPAPPACPYGTTGYEGPGTEFEATNVNEGKVKFTGAGLAPGSSTYFGLENPVTCQSVGGKLKCTSGPVGPSVCSTEVGEGTNTKTVPLSTTESCDLIVAFVQADGPYNGGAAQTLKVSSPHLTWTLAGRENKGLGDAEIWVAKPTGPLAAEPITVTANVTTPGSPKGKGYVTAITAVAFSNAPSYGTVTKCANKHSSEPTCSLTTAQDDSWVWGSGNDWLNSVARTTGPAQTLQSQQFDPVGDTYWVQSTEGLTPNAGTSVTINDTAPTKDVWNYVLIEVQ